LRFIPDPQTVAQMSDEQLHTLVHDLGASPEKSTAAKRCMHGTTLLIALLDPSRSNLWVASLGDCQAGKATPIQLQIRSSPTRSFRTKG
jgi:pyruvate dehydrogenase phosphatase